MKATRHNGRSGKHGTYDAKHNDRRFDVENSEHIDAERTKMNVYWDCYQGYSLQNDKDERARFTFTEIEKAYYVEKYSDHVDGQNEGSSFPGGSLLTDCRYISHQVSFQDICIRSEL